MPQVIRTPKVYDAIIVGSGAGGGIAAYVLARAGAKCLMLEGGWQVPGEPYTTERGSDWRWWRSRMLGGRTNHWGRISLRMGPYDFKPYSRDGRGFDWPISYEDLALYYDKTEELIGVFGSHEGLENTPDGKFQPPPKPRCYELLVQKACRKLGIPCIPGRLSIITRPLNGR